MVYFVLKFYEPHYAFVVVQGSFMDDTFYSVRKDCSNVLTDKIIGASQIQLKSTAEDKNYAVNYLNMEIIRNIENNRIEFKWWQKPQSACRILDYHSFHPIKMKINIITEFVKNALEITSKKFWSETINTIKRVLSNSNYPNRLTKRILTRICKDLGNIEVTSSIGEVDPYMNAIEVYKEMTKFNHIKQLNNSLKEDSGMKYLAVLHHPNIRALLKKLKIRNISIAPRISLKNRSHIWTNTKDRRKLSGITNASFRIKCIHCKFEWRCKTRNLDIIRTASHHFKNKFSIPFTHANENKSHTMVIDHKSIKAFRSRKELELYK